MSEPYPPQLPPQKDEYVPTPEELAGNSYGYCYTGMDVFPLRPLEKDHDH